MVTVGSEDSASLASTQSPRSCAIATRLAGSAGSIPFCADADHPQHVAHHRGVDVDPAQPLDPLGVAAHCEGAVAAHLQHDGVERAAAQVVDRRASRSQALGPGVPGWRRPPARATGELRPYPPASGPGSARRA